MIGNNKRDNVLRSNEEVNALILPMEMVISFRVIIGAKAGTSHHLPGIPRNHAILSSFISFPQLHQQHRLFCLLLPVT